MFALKFKLKNFLFHVVIIGYFLMPAGDELFARRRQRLLHRHRPIDAISVHST